MKIPAPVPLSSDGRVAALIFGVLGGLYWALRCPTFGPGDSPQHVLSAVTWGVSWPPGYPLYTLLAHLFASLPGAASANVNGFSGLLHAAAAAMFYLTLRRLDLKPLSALFATALMSLSPLFWYYSEIAEVRALNDLLAILAVYYAVAWGEEKNPLQLYALAGAIGFGVSHHPTYILILPALGYWLVSRRAFPDVRRAVAFVAIAAACCAFPYLILGLRLTFGSPAYNLTGVTTFGGVLDLFLRKNLGGPFRMVAGRGLVGPGGFDFAAFGEHLGWFARTAGEQLNPLGAGLAALGLAAAYRARRPAFVLWLTWLAVTALFFIALSSQQLHLHDPAFARAVAARFYLLPMIAAFAFVGFGAEFLFDRLPPTAGWGLLAAAIGLSLILRPIDLRRRNFTMDYAREIVRGTGPADMIIVDTDASNFALLYLDAVEHATGDRVPLIPSLMNFPPYRDWLRSRHPSLIQPPDDAVMAWGEWRRLNPSRALYAEAEWKDQLLPQFPGSAPDGVLMRVSTEASPADSAAKEAAFLAGSPVVGAVTRKSVYPFSMDMALLETYRILQQWNASTNAKADYPRG